MQVWVIAFDTRSVKIESLVQTCQVANVEEASNEMLRTTGNFVVSPGRELATL